MLWNSELSKSSLATPRSHGARGQVLGLDSHLEPVDQTHQPPVEEHLITPADAAMLAWRDGVSSSRCSYISSRVPWEATSLEAVFSPTPGTPGKLSEVSPRNAA